MARSYKPVLWLLLVAVPVMMTGLWLASGREVLTKSGRFVDVEVADDLFGDTITQKRFVRGPVFGYHVGLDLVVLSAVVAIAIAGGMLFFSRRRLRRSQSMQERTVHEG